MVLVELAALGRLSLAVNSPMISSRPLPGPLEPKEVDSLPFMPLWSESMSLDPCLVHVDERPAEEYAALFVPACIFVLPFPFGCPRLDGTPRANASSA